MRISSRASSNLITHLRCQLFPMTSMKTDSVEHHLALTDYLIFFVPIFLSLSLSLSKSRQYGARPTCEFCVLESDDTWMINKAHDDEHATRTRAREYMSGFSRVIRHLYRREPTLPSVLPFVQVPVSLSESSWVRRNPSFPDRMTGGSRGTPPGTRTEHLVV